LPALGIGTSIGQVELQFAQAVALAASGATDNAINRYGALAADTPLGRAARYNAANLLLRQAIELHSTRQPGQALALVELAKEGFREVLRQEPQHWAARYNLERAQRLVPDPEADADFANEAPAAAERSATTMRGYTPGLP
jgi:mxaK protein